MNKKTTTLILMLLLAVVGAKATIVVPSSCFSEPASGSFYLYNVTQQQFLMPNLENEAPAFSDLPEEVVLEAIDGDAHSRYKILTGSGYYLKAGHAKNNSHLMWLNPWENADQFKWGFKAASNNTYRLFTWFSISFNDNGYTWAQYNNYFNSCTSSTSSENDADEWALISPSDYKAYFVSAQIPASFRSGIPTVEGQYYIYDISNRKFLDTRDGSLDDVPQALTTITPSGEKFLITGYPSYYLKVGVNLHKYLWYNGNNTNKWVIEAKSGEESTKAFRLYTDEFSETNSYIVGKSWYLENNNLRYVAPSEYNWALISATDYENWQNSFVLDEATGYSATTDIYNVNVTVNRAMTAKVWNTLVVPFDMAIPSGWTVKEPTAFADGTLTFGDASSIEAGKPYIVKPTEAVTSFSATGVTLKKDLVNTTVGEGTTVTMTGTYEAGTVPTDSYIIGIKNGESNLYKVNSSVNIKPFRAYFTISGGSGEARIALNFDDDEVTGITLQEKENESENAGMKDGKYFENGKIVIVKNGMKYTTNGQIVK